MKGYLTYSLAVLAVVAGLYALLYQKDAGNGWELIWIGLSVFGLRRAIGK